MVELDKVGWQWFSVVFLGVFRKPLEFPLSELPLMMICSWINVSVFLCLENMGLQ